MAGNDADVAVALDRMVVRELVDKPLSAVMPPRDMRDLPPVEYATDTPDDVVGLKGPAKN